MEANEIRRISSIARALWADPREAGPVVAETLAAVSLQSLSDEQMIESLGRGLLERASHQAAAVSIEAPFFRLSTTERFVLGALHHARWSYARLGRVLGLTEIQVAEFAWGARLELATSPSTGVRVPFPAASAPGRDCPEYHPGHPWTQRFMDEELSSREQSFLQAHAEVCVGCRQTLMRAREFYHGVGKWVPRLTDDEQSYWDRELTRVQERSFQLKSREMSVVESLAIFSRRWDIRLLFALVVVVAWHLRFK